jgi:hypothetical protein
MPSRRPCLVNAQFEGGEKGLERAVRAAFQAVRGMLSLK